MQRLHNDLGDAWRRGHSLESFQDQSERVAGICDLLEALADDLPHRPPAVWNEAKRLCVDVVYPHRRSIAELLLPALIRTTSGDANCQKMLGQIKVEMCAQLFRFFELSCLMDEADLKRSGGTHIEAIGFALREFFETSRRFVAWEQKVLFPLAAGTLQPSDFEYMASGLHLVEPAGR